MRRSQKRRFKCSEKHSICVIEGFRKLTCHGKGEEGEKSHIPSRNISVGLFVHHEPHLLQNAKVGTPKRSLFPVLSFVGAILLLKAHCPRDRYPHLLLQFYMELFKVLKIFSNLYFQLSLILYFSPFFLSIQTRNIKMAGKKKKRGSSDQVFVTLIL